MWKCISCSFVFASSVLMNSHMQSWRLLYMGTGILEHLKSLIQSSLKVLLWTWRLATFAFAFFLWQKSDYDSLPLKTWLLDIQLIRYIYLFFSLQQWKYEIVSISVLIFINFGNMNLHLYVPYYECNKLLPSKTVTAWLLKIMIER